MYGATYSHENRSAYFEMSSYTIICRAIFTAANFIDTIHKPINKTIIPDIVIEH